MLHDDPINRAAKVWDQLRLWPPDTWRLDFTVFLPSDGSAATHGWRVRSFPDDELMEMEVAHPVDLVLVDEIAARDLRQLIHRWRARIPPFA